MINYKKISSCGLLIEIYKLFILILARALIRNPKILLLDEATLLLDTQSMDVVQDALEIAMKCRTSIVATSQLNTIHNSDKIFVIDEDGVLVEQGSHCELIDKRNVYFKLHQLFN